MLTKDKSYLKDGNIIFEVEQAIASLVKKATVKHSISSLIRDAKMYIKGDYSKEGLFVSKSIGKVFYGGPDAMEELIFSEEGKQYALNNAPSWAKSKRFIPN
jgi:hypothetical protein